MNSLGLFLIILQFLTGSVSDSQSRILGLFNILSQEHSVADLATGLNFIVGPIRHPSAPELTLGSRAVVIIDDASGKVLYDQSSTTRLPMASITKLMTALVVLDATNNQTNGIVTVASQATAETGSKMYLLENERITVHNLLRGLLIQSANDAAVALAYGTTRNQDEFIQRMNAKATSLGLTNTRFANPTGFDAPGHYSTAQDIAKLAQVALANPIIADIVTTQRLTVQDTSRTHNHTLTTTNQLLGQYKNVIGVKTGTTGEAGASFVTSAVGAAGQKVIVVLLDSPDRFGEARQALDWALQNHSWIEPL